MKEDYLFLTVIPALDVSLTDLAQMNYQQVAYEVMKLMS